MLKATKVLVHMHQKSSVDQIYMFSTFWLWLILAYLVHVQEHVQSKQNDLDYMTSIDKYHVFLKFSAK